MTDLDLAKLRSSAELSITAINPTFTSATVLALLDEVERLQKFEPICTSLCVANLDPEEDCLLHGRTHRETWELVGEREAEIERLRTITDAQVEAAAEVLTLDIDGSEWDEISPKAQDKVRELARQCLEAAREARE